MKKKACIVTYDQEAAIFYSEIIGKLFGKSIEIETRWVGEKQCFEKTGADLYIVTTCSFGGDVVAKSKFSNQKDVVIIERTICKESLDKLKSIEVGTKALVVNITQRMAIETIAHLTNLGINQIKFIPYDSENISYMPSYDIVITPGETRFINDCDKEVIDIGDRVLSENTIVEIALKLNLENYLEKENFKIYLDTLPRANYSLDHLFNKSISLESNFSILLEILEMGIIGVDEHNNIYAYNQKAQSITGINSKIAIGENANEYFQDIPFKECYETFEEINNKLIKINGVNIDISVRPVIRMGKYRGAFATLQKFSEVENKQHKIREQLLNRGHYAKYRFEDILGESSVIEKTRKLAKKMAKSSASIIVTGESGTGKELFANAIHNESLRHKHPFVAINCGAIPDNLLESELFGYEEGAFTGAKKGGKIGLFEFAHNGTLFLDEIEAMTPMLQIKLLRVLQEKEVMRLGGDKIIKVDVRVVAATNEKILELVAKGEFRKDLYYRLCTLPIELPPLRDRGEDIFLLIDKSKKEFGGKFKLSQEVIELFKKHKWEGNIRELRNYVEYFCYIGDEVIKKEDLPSSFKEEIYSEYSIENIYKKSTKSMMIENTIENELRKVAGAKIDKYVYVLKSIDKFCKEDKTIGRKTISDNSKEIGINLSEQEVRTIFTKLEGINLITISKGRRGTKITENGMDLIENIRGTS
ncbi:MAG: sigma 54-interacting transcriptional regulator [Romboutsia sp.]